MRQSELALVLSVLLAFSTNAVAGKPDTAPAPTPTPVSMPATRLQTFLEAHLDEILSPLDSEGLKHPNVIVDLKSSLADDAAKMPAAKAPAFRVAIGVCDALTNALNERQTAADNLAGASSASSTTSLGVVSSSGRLTRKQLHSEDRNREENGKTNARFVDAAKSQWTRRAAELRQGIQQLYLREREVERQIDAAAQTNAVAESRREAIRRYPDLAVQGSKLNTAYVARYSDYQRTQPNYFQDTSWPLHLADEVAQPPQ